LMMVELLCNREEKKEMIFFIDREPHLSWNGSKTFKIYIYFYSFVCVD
jgi:hypothetical protein